MESQGYIPPAPVVVLVVVGALPNMLPVLGGCPNRVEVGVLFCVVETPPNKLLVVVPVDPVVGAAAAGGAPNKEGALAVVPVAPAAGVVVPGAELNNPLLGAVAVVFVVEDGVVPNKPPLVGFAPNKEVEPVVDVAAGWAEVPLVVFVVEVAPGAGVAGLEPKIPPVVPDPVPNKLLPEPEPVPVAAGVLPNNPPVVAGLSAVGVAGFAPKENPPEPVAVSDAAEPTKRITGLFDGWLHWNE